MIFNNEAALAEAAVDATPIIGGYDSLYGGALALVENAQNEYSIFKAMLTSDYSELNMRKSGVEESVLESNIESMREASVAAIKEKIAKIFETIASKIKEIWMKFSAAFLGIIKKDKPYMDKLCDKALKNDKQDIEIKWPKQLSEEIPGIKIVDKLADIISGTKGSNIEALSVKDWEAKMIGEIETVKVSEVAGGAGGIVDTFKATDPKKLEGDMKQVIKQMNGLAGEAKKTKEDIGEDAYKNVTAYTSHVINYCTAKLAVEKQWYKLSKSAIIKLAAGAPKNEAASLYITAVCEAAEDEVDAVIDAQLPKEEVSDVSTATKDVLDPGVSDTADVSALRASDNTSDYKPTEPKVEPREESAAGDDEVDDVIEDLLPGEEVSDVSTATKDVLDPGVSDTADVSALRASDNTSDYKPTEPKVEPREESTMDILSELF